MLNSKSIFTKVKISRRSNRGFSLVSVILTASLTSIFLLASAAFIIPMYRNIGGAYANALLLTSAESATDYVIGLLNDSTTRSTVDCGMSYGSARHLNDSMPILATAFGLPSDAKIDIWVRNAAPSRTATVGSSNSLSFDPVLSPYGDPDLPDSLKNSPDKWGLFQGAGKNPYRVIECRVSYGGFKKLLFTTLKPFLEAEAYSPTASKPNALFSSGGVNGVSSAWIGRGSTTGGLDLGLYDQNKIDPNTGAFALLDGDVGSFGNVSVAEDASIGGHLQILQNADLQVNGQPANENKGGVVTQSLNANISDPATISDNFDTSNVLNASNVSSPQAAPGTELTGSSPSFSAVIPAPSAPANASYAGPMLYEGGASLIAGGDYEASSLNVSSGSSLNVSAGDPVRIYLDGSTNDGVALNVSGDINATGVANPANFQIFYNGTGSLNFQVTGNKTVNAIIYAPNANVIMSSLGGKLKYSGAILAKNLAGSVSGLTPTSGITNTNVRFDTSLKNPSVNGPGMSLRVDESKILSSPRLKVLSVLEPADPQNAIYNNP